MTTLDKVRWILGLAVVFVLVVVAGRSHVHGSKKLHAAIETLYEDRLVVKGLLFDLSSIIHAKELAIARADRAYFAEQSEAATARGRELIERFRGTYLVPNEKDTLERFATRYAELAEAEAALDLEREGPFEGDGVEHLNVLLTGLHADVDALAQIQLDEGRRQMMLGGKAADQISRFDKIETYMFAILGALAVIIVLFIPKRSTA